MDTYHQPHRFMRPPPPSMADHHHHHQQQQPPPRQPAPWFPGQFQYHPSQSSSPSPLPPHQQQQQQQWAPPPPPPPPPQSDHLPPHSYPPPPLPPYPPHPVRNQFPPPPRPHFPPPHPSHPHSQVPQSYPQHNQHALRRTFQIKNMKLTLASTHINFLNSVYFLFAGLDGCVLKSIMMDVQFGLCAQTLLGYRNGAIQVGLITKVGITLVSFFAT
ncbi:hypothetical protein CK203_070295 [Vitis vinifera]|uniref:Uncharacterized protein n=1 Tax=Vitis vinifera TaxID=29760 RepID=A0A438E6Q5_VITVI|nr:hypothetical protein CK203_070295 [Vitis vinifera]